MKRDGEGARRFAAQRSTLARSGPLKAKRGAGPSDPPEARTGSPRARQRSGKPKPDPVTPEVRAQVHARSGGKCEARFSVACSGEGQHLHHRKLRRHGDHRAVALLDTCWNCHTAAPDSIHRDTKRAVKQGMLVPSWNDPAEVPVVPGPELPRRP